MAAICGLPITRRAARTFTSPSRSKASRVIESGNEKAPAMPGRWAICAGSARSRSHGELHGRGGKCAAASSHQLMRYHIEVPAQAGTDLVDRGLGRWHMAQCVQRDEIVDRAIVAGRIDADTRLLQL